MVDDDADCVQLISSVLKIRYHGLDVISAKNGLEAFKLIQGDEVPILVLADYRMPVMKGNELGKALRRAYGRKVDMVLVTGQPVTDAIARDFDQILEKPFDLERLYSVVDAAITRRASEIDHE
ncbi:MAG: response regulator [Candidatus Lokiarchaeota archaeon]|nr:response regulator [Candidatus Lokiarchaeota archaeon]